MKKWWMKGLAIALCAGMLTPVAAVSVPGAGMTVYATASTDQTSDNGNNNSGNTTDTKTDETDKITNENLLSAVNSLKAQKISLQPNEKQSQKLDAKLAEAYAALGYDGSACDASKCQYQSKEEVDAYVEVVKSQMNDIVNSPKDDSDDDDDDSDDTTTVTADHFLMVGGTWVTPVANAGQEVSIVLPVVNMGKTNVTNAVVTPVLSTDTATWPFEITQSSYSQTISDLPGTDTGMSDMDRRRELTWNLKTRSDVGNGYQKISFNVRYFASDGSSQTTTLDTYIQTSGTAGVSSDGKASVPRVIVTGFETDPETVHAGESFMLTLHLKNTSNATSVSNMLFEFDAVVEGKDADTTYASFLPTAGSNTIFVDKMEKNGTKDIQIEMEARSDLAQKPYAIDVNMSYEDEHVNSYTNKASVSVPVKQAARVDMSEPEVNPSSIDVGSEANIMFSIYNLGKTKLYNVKVSADSEFVSSGDAFVGNLDSGATGSVDMYVNGLAATTDDGTVKLNISYEDETGEATVIERTISLYVTEPVMDDDMSYDDMSMDDQTGTGGGVGKAIPVIVVFLLLAGGGAMMVSLKKKKLREQKKLEEDLTDLDEEDNEKE